MPALFANVPEGIVWGRVTAYITSFVADGGTESPDGTPDAVPLEGTITLTPTVGVMVFPTLTPPQQAVIQSLECPIIGGVLYAPGTTFENVGDRDPGVILVASEQPLGLPDRVQYKVAWALKGARVSPPPVTIDVPSQATVDLATVIPSTPGPGVVVVVSTETAERAEAAAVRAEQIVADLEGWEPGGGGASSWTAITGKPAVIAAGESAVEARAVIGAVSVEDLPDVSVFATKTELTSGLAGKQAAGDYATTASLATVATTGAYADLTGKPTIPLTPDLSGYATKTELASGLAEKQPVGDYATKAELPDVSGLATKTALASGLAGKQDAGDYATTTALTSGLAGKQPVGDYATTADLPDLGAYATTAYVDQAVGDIDTALAGILGGE